RQTQQRHTDRPAGFARRGRCWEFVERVDDVLVKETFDAETENPPSSSARMASSPGQFRLARGGEGWSRSDAGRQVPNTVLAGRAPVCAARRAVSPTAAPRG